MSAILDGVTHLITKAVAAWTSRETLLCFGVMALLVVATPLLRGASGYWSRGLLTDAAYTFFYLGGIFSFLAAAPLLRGLNALVAHQAPFLRQGLLAALPPALAFLVLFVVMDLCSYWAHRATHALAPLWLFHAIHHSQAHPTALTNFRFHAGDVFFRTLVQFVPFTLLGAPAFAGVPLLWVTVPLTVFLEALAHCDLGWTFGPLGAVLVSPAFHRVHHSAEPRHHHRNYGIAFSFWDRLFGTADETVERPAAYGAPDMEVPESFLRQLAYPFIALARRIRRPAGASARRQAS